MEPDGSPDAYRIAGGQPWQLTNTFKFQTGIPFAGLFSANRLGSFRVNSGEGGNPSLSFFIHPSFNLPPNTTFSPAYRTVAAKGFGERRNYQSLPPSTISPPVAHAQRTMTEPKCE